MLPRSRERQRPGDDIAANELASVDLRCHVLDPERVDLEDGGGGAVQY